MNREMRVRRVAAEEAAQCVDGLADVLVDCVEGGASVSFMLPLAREKAIAFWQTVAGGVERGDRALLVAQDGEAVDALCGLFRSDPAHAHLTVHAFLLTGKDGVDSATR